MEQYHRLLWWDTWREGTSNSIIDRYDEIHPYGPAVDDPNDVSTELERKVARYVHALHKQKAAREQRRRTCRSFVLARLISWLFCVLYIDVFACCCITRAEPVSSEASSGSSSSGSSSSESRPEPPAKRSKQWLHNFGGGRKENNHDVTPSHFQPWSLSKILMLQVSVWHYKTLGTTCSESISRRCRRVVVW